MLVLGFGLSPRAEATTLHSIEYRDGYIIMYIRSMRPVKVNQAEKQGPFDFKHSQPESPRILQSLTSHVFRTSLLRFNLAKTNSPESGPLESLAFLIIK